jgi:hypothetical protein
LCKYSKIAANPTKKSNHRQGGEKTPHLSPASVYCLHLKLMGASMNPNDRELAVRQLGERILVKKHNIQVNVDIPKSAKGWQKLISSYEDTPILVARTADGKEVVGILMDEPIQ